VIVIVALGLSVLAFCMCLVLALGRVAASADRNMDELIRASPDPLPRDTYALRDAYAGLARAHATMACESSTTVPSSSWSVGTQRFPVSSCTSRRPRVRLKTPGSSAKP